ncbi:MAG: tetratricopeptide repeat protein [Gammaproteobacteria bacterium]|nr:tetratricopeptide repeat protein [Gammaproteobacteria bacterium]MDH3481515.1 tetratricopeptide repeat protein [Gammaproteobacteria bacterium]
MLRRRVYPVVIAYALVCWALLQIGEVTFEPLGLPGWVMTLLVVLVIAGFPLAAILAWMFDITPSGIRRDARPMIADTTIDDPASIAVVPFTDMSPQKDQAYFCEGIAEAILHALTKIELLRVAARISSFRYANADADLQDIGRKLGVSTILEGSVRKSGDRLRVTAQLVNVKDGYHLWSKSYDRKLEDVFAVQDEIASSIAGLLLNTVTPIETTSTQDVLAYDYYLRGRQFLNRFRKVDLESARQMFHQAIKKDPKFALAWASYADCYALEVMYADPTSSFKAKAREASERALALNPDLAESHASVGLAHMINDDFERAEQYFNKAIEINPGLYEAYYYFARCRFHQGDMASAAELFEKAASVNPDEYQSRMLRVLVLRGAGRLDEAKDEARRGIAVVEKHLEWNPDDVRALLLGAGSLIVLGEIERAERWMHRAMDIDPNDPISLYNLGCNLAMLNKAEEALDYLERAFEHGTISKDWMQHDADLVNLHSHPRYAALLEKLAA